MLTDTLPTQQFATDGYCLIRNLIPRDVVEAVRRRVVEITAEPPAWPAGHFQYLDPAKYPRPDGSAQPGALQTPAKCEAVFAAMADHPALQAAMAGLLGGPVVRHTDQVGIKLGRITEEQGGRSYYHQDSYYWKLPPELGCNVWIPLQDVGPDAITLGVMPGSHRGWTLIEHESYFDDPAWGGVRDGVYTPFKRHRIPASVVGDAAGEVVVTMGPGDALFFGTYTWHRSEPNRSGEDKAFYAIAYRRSE